MQFEQNARPGNSAAIEAMHAYLRYKKGEGDTGFHSELGCILGAMGFVLAAILAVGCVIDGPALLAVVFAAVAVVLLPYTIWAFRVEPTPVTKYNRHRLAGDIIVVPQIVVDRVAQHAARHEGLQRWDGYQAHRFEVLGTVMAAVSHDIQPLVNECDKCAGQPDTCLSITHLHADARGRIDAVLDAAITQALVPVVEAFNAHLTVALEERADYNRALGGSAAPSLPDSSSAGNFHQT